MWSLESAIRQYFITKLQNEDAFNYLCTVVDSSRERLLRTSSQAPVGSIDEEYFTARPTPEPLKIVTQEIEVIDRKY